MRKGEEPATGGAHARGTAQSSDEPHLAQPSQFLHDPAREAVRECYGKVHVPDFDVPEHRNRL